MKTIAGMCAALALAGCGGTEKALTPVTPPQVPDASTPPVEQGDLLGPELFPNPTSETQPPAGADLNDPAWAGLYDAGADAYEGRWVRRLAAAKGRRALAGLGPFGGNLPLSELGTAIPCSPGAQFVIAAQAKAVSVGEMQMVAIAYGFYDSNNDNLQAAPMRLVYVSRLASGVGASDFPAVGWNRIGGTTVIAPAGTTSARFYLMADSDGGDVDAWFDEISVRRIMTAP